MVLPTALGHLLSSLNAKPKNFSASKKKMLAIKGAMAMPIMIFTASLNESPTDASNVRSIKIPAIMVASACNKLFASNSITRFLFSVVVVFARAADFLIK